MQSTLLRKKFGLDFKNSALWKWAAGGGQVETSGTGSAEQRRLEETERTLKTIRENVLWWLRGRLEGVAEVQRGMVEKRIERIKEKEKSVLHRMSSVPGVGAGGFGPGSDGGGLSMRDRPTASDILPDVIDEKEKAEIESKLSPEQLQLFAQENDGLLKHYEDTLGKVKTAEKSLLEISSLQQTLVMHLSTQEDFINQLVSDAANTETNVGQANKDLKRATERRSTAQAVFWGTVGLCTWLIIWDAIF
ncbi:syntaxin [Histoplasma capsulatum H143]|nr:syntaxin [Histoplasma capsulatum H143]